MLKNLLPYKQVKKWLELQTDYRDKEDIDRRKAVCVYAADGHDEPDGIDPQDDGDREHLRDPAADRLRFLRSADLPLFCGGRRPRRSDDRRLRRADEGAPESAAQ